MTDRLLKHHGLILPSTRSGCVIARFKDVGEPLCPASYTILHPSPIELISLPAVPLAIAVPAAAASLAYLNAKTQFGYDFILAASLVKSRLRAAAAEKKDRVNLFYKLEEHAHSKHTADRTFLVYEGKSWTFKETYDIVLKYGTWMKTTYGIGPKEVVALDFQNSAQFLFVWFALWAIGANPAFINYNLTSKPLLHCIKTSSARIVFVDEGVKSQFSSEVLDELSSTSFRNGKGCVEVVYVGEDVGNKVMTVQGAREPDSSRAGVEGLQMAILIYTSGTTGNPKPAIVNWIKLYTAGNFMETWLPLKKTDRYYTVRFSPDAYNSLLRN